MVRPPTCMDVFVDVCRSDCIFQTLNESGKNYQPLIKKNVVLIDEKYVIEKLSTVDSFSTIEHWTRTRSTHAPICTPIYTNLYFKINEN